MTGEADSLQNVPKVAASDARHRTAQGLWITRAKDGCVTGAFTAPLEVASFALRRLQPRYAPRTMRRAKASQARSS